MFNFISQTLIFFHFLSKSHVSFYQPNSFMLSPFSKFHVQFNQSFVAFSHFVFKSPSILSIAFCHISALGSNLTSHFISPVLSSFDRCRQISCAFLTFISCHFFTLYSNLMFCFNHHSRSFFHFLI